MRIWVLGTKGLPANYGGFETFAEQLVKTKNDNKLRFIIVNEKDIRKHKCVRYTKNTLILRSPFLATGIQSIAHDTWSLFIALKKSCSCRLENDKILLLGTSGGLALPILKLIFRAKPISITTNIAGLEWSRDKWGWAAQKLLKLSEFFCVRYSDEVVTDNIELQRYCYKEYGKKTHFIPYGGDQYLSIPPDPSILGDLPTQFDFALARAQSDNNLELLLESYASSSLNLVLVSNWKSCKFGVDLQKKYSEYSNLHLIGPIYEKSKISALYKFCRFYVHGHSAGGTNPTLVEAMNEGCDILAFGVAYNIETTQNEAQYFNCVASLEKLTNSWDLDTSSKRAFKLQSIAKKSYRWRSVCNDYIELMDKITS
jgi:hypothetical protein